MVNSSKAWPLTNTTTPSSATSSSTTTVGFVRLLVDGSMSPPHLATASVDTLYGYAHSLAECGHIAAALEVLAHIGQRLPGVPLPLNQLQPVCLAILTSCVAPHSPLARSPQRRVPKGAKWTPSTSSQAPSSSCYSRHTSSRRRLTLDPSSHDHLDVCCAPSGISRTTTPGANHLQVADPLACAICGDQLRSPTTALCGHTFCGDCCATDSPSLCPVCGRKFRTFKPDVLVGRLVEKWWSPEANRRAEMLLERRQLDEALKVCNESLDKCE